MEHILSQFIDRGLPLSGMRFDTQLSDLTDDNLRSILRLEDETQEVGGRLHAMTHGAAEDKGPEGHEDHKGHEGRGAPTSVAEGAMDGRQKSQTMVQVP